MKFSEIPKLTKISDYRVNVSIRSLKDNLKYFDEGYGLEMCPDFQRGHVWSESQQIAYLEYLFRGGISGREIYFNCISWGKLDNTPIQLVDGLQRITSALRFLNSEIPIFGTLYKDFEDGLSHIEPGFIFCVNNLRTKSEVLKWYIELNEGGVIHTPDEISKVKKMLEEELKKSYGF